MPVWLTNPPSAETAGQRWGRRFMFLGAAVLTVAVGAGATYIVLDLQESNSSMAVVAANAPVEPGAVKRLPEPAQIATLPYIEKRQPSVPPLVLLPQDAAAAKKDAAAAAALAAPVVQAAAPAAVIAAPPKVVSAPAPLVVKKVEKPAPVVAATAQAPKKVALAAKPIVKPKPVAKKPVKRPVELAKAKPVKGTMLQPPRERLDADDDAVTLRKAIDRRCRPGELARECEARTR